jgi:hypothetical protein
MTCVAGVPVPDMGPRARLWLAFVGALSVLAGCLGGPADKDPLVVGEEEPEEAPPVPEPPPRALRTLRFPLARPVDDVHWVNGSFEPEETGLAGGFLSGEFRKFVDLSSLLPAAVPTHVAVEVHMDITAIPLVGPTGRADPVANDTVWYELEWESPEPGRFLLDGIAKRNATGTFGIALEAYLPGTASAPGLDYSIRIRAQSDPETIPGGVPVALRLDANETVWLESPGEGFAELLVFGPTDTLVGRLYFEAREDWRVPRGVHGELVFMPVHGSPGIRVGRLIAEGGDPGSLRALGFQRETGEAHILEPQQRTTWSFEVEERPLRVSITVTGEGGQPWGCTGVLAVALAAPAETVLQNTVECPSPTNIPLLHGDGWTWWTAVGDPRLVPGTYEAAVDAGLWWGFAAHHVVEWYER